MTGDALRLAARPWRGGEPAGVVEWSEACAYAGLIEAAPPDLALRLRLGVRPAAGGCALVAGGIAATLVLNRVIGLGMVQPAGDDALDLVTSVYRDAGVPAHAIELCPAALPAGLAGRLSARGYLPFKKTTMMMRACTPLEDTGADGVVVRRAGIDEADAWAALACSVFGFDANMHAILRATFGGACWQHWLATVDAEIAGVAATHVVDETAWIGWVCTAPRYRGRGIQRRITAAQLAGARDAGARWVTLEAATGSPTRPGASLRNYRRMDFQAVHERLTYLHRSAG